MSTALSLIKMAGDLLEEAGALFVVTPLPPEVRVATSEDLRVALRRIGRAEGRLQPVEEPSVLSPELREVLLSALRSGSGIATPSHGSHGNPSPKPKAPRSKGKAK